MRLQRIVRALALCVLVSSLCGRAIAAQKLEAFAGVIGGAPNGPNAAANIPGSCSTYGSAAPIFSFFGSSSLLSVPQGGIAFCGYSGDMNDQTATAGPLTATQTLGPTILGNPGYAGYFNGSADATADFWTLKAAAHGQISGGVEGTTLALNGSAAAAFFEDTFTQTSL